MADKRPTAAGGFLIALGILGGAGVGFAIGQATPGLLIGTAIGVAAALLVTLLAGSLPFCAMGLALGYLVGPNSAAAVVNLVYLPMVFVSGLWIPVEQLPGFMQRFAPALPPYHYAQLALSALGAGRGGAAWGHVLALLGFTALFLAVAVWAYRRDEGRTYG